MLSIVLNLFTLLGILFASGYVGGWVADGYAAKRTHYDVGNVGFFSGAAGGAVILLFAVLWWWSGLLHAHIW
jgi:hypothetical protein